MKVCLENFNSDQYNASLQIGSRYSFLLNRATLQPSKKFLNRLLFLRHKLRSFSLSIFKNMNLLDRRIVCGMIQSNVKRRKPKLEDWNSVVSSLYVKTIFRPIMLQRLRAGGHLEARLWTSFFTCFLGLTSIYFARLLSVERTGTKPVKIIKNISKD